jgi:hypothetical protein
MKSLKHRSLVLFTSIFLLALGMAGVASTWQGSLGDPLGARVSAAEKATAKSQPLSPQTVVLSDDFEGATTFVAANSGVNAWVIGTAAANGGTKGAYISNDAGVSNAYTNTVTSGNHIYAPIVVPAGETAAVLSFDWRTVADFDANADFDYLRVSVRTTIPVAGTMPTAAEQIPVTYSGQDNFTRAYVNLPASVATGTTQYIVFSWVNDSSVGSLPAAIDNVLVTSQVPAPLSGTKTIPGSYPSIGAAIADVNANGADTSGGSLIFNVASGSTFTETPFPLTASGSSATNRIVFQKSGGGANPKVVAEGGGNFGAPQTSLTGGVVATSDAVIAINSADFVTFNGIDVASSSVSGAAPFGKVDYGYLLRNNNILANVTTINGAQNNIIQNTTITLDRRKTAPTPTIGIMQSASTVTGGGSTATSAAQANSGNKYYNLTITNAYSGIYLLGTAAFPDDLTEVGTTSPTTFNSIGTATANDIGNGTTLTWGIRFASQSNAKVFNNEIRNVTNITGSTATVAGIHMDNAGTVTAVSLGTTQVYNNIIHDLSNAGTAAGVVFGIRANITGNAGSIGRIYNNFIYGLNSGSTVTTTVRMFGMQVQDAGTGTGATFNVQNNSIRLAPTSIATINTCFGIGGAAATNPTYDVRNNIFANFTGAQAGAAKHYTWVSTSNTSIGAAVGTVSDFNDLYIANTTNGFVGRGSTLDFADLTAWRAMQAGAGPDDTSISADPVFASVTDLHITGISPARNTGTTIGAITNDIDNEARPNEAIYEIGADEFYPQPGILALSSATYAGNEGTTLVATVNRTSGTSGIVSATYTLTDGTATGGAACTAGIDYINTGGTVTFPDSNGSQPINITLCSDAIVDPAEAFTITLSAPTGGATLGSPTVATATITDVPPPFNGSYSVGAAQPYTSLTNVGGIFEAINTGGATGNITINVTSDLTSETGAVSLNQIAGGFTVNIQPSGGPRVISGSNATVLINLNGADGVTFSGLPFGGQSLTLRNTNATSGSVIRYINDASSNLITSCIIEQNNSASSAVFYSTGTTTGNDNNVLTGSIVRGTSSSVIPFNSIVSSGTSTAISNTGLNISNNQIVDFGQAGILILTGTDGITVSSNDISETADRATALTGINLNGSTLGTNLITNNRIHGLRSSFLGAGNPSVEGMFFADARTTTISGNYIYDFPALAAGTGRIVGIEYDGSSSAAPSLTIVNNFININTTNASANPVFGIFDFAFGTNIITIDHNTVFISGTSTGGATSWGIARGTSAPTTYTMRNNLVINNRVSTGNSFAGGDQSAATGTFVSDGNFFAGIGTTPANFMDYGSSGTGTPVTTAAWQTGPPARDAGSAFTVATGLIISDIFVNQPANDLHIKPTAGASILGAGITVATVTTDIDGDPRPAAPDRGADELVEAVGGVFPAGTFFNAKFQAGNTLGGNVIVNNVLYLVGGGQTNVGANTVELGCGATVVGADATNYIIGNVQEDFCNLGTFTYPVGTTPNGSARGDGSTPEGSPPPEYSPVVVTLNAGTTFPSSLTISAADTYLPGLGATSSLSRNWSVTKVGTVNADMKFQYLNEDVYGVETSYKPFKYNGVTTIQQPGSINDVLNQFTATGVTSFSQWGAGVSAPTAANADISGRVTTAGGMPIANVKVTLTGGGLDHTVIGYTSSLGYYNFEGLPVGQNYVVSVKSRRFFFSEPSHFITLQDNITDGDFVADPQ